MNTFTRREFLKTSGAGVLMVSFSLGSLANASTSQGLRDPKVVKREVLDSWLSIDQSGKITIFSGKVDLGTGVKTALAQIAADELYVPFNAIEMVMGDTATTPDQWITGGALSISQGGTELRQAAANARQALLERASQKLQIPASELLVRDGMIFPISNPAQKLSYGSLIGDGFKLEVNPKVVLKNPNDYRVIGKSIQRVDIPEKVTGEYVYMHDFKLPGMLHARVVRPNSIGAKLASFDDSGLKKIKGYVQTVRKGDFLVVISTTEWGAVKAARDIKVSWTKGPDLPKKATIFKEWREMPIAKEDVTQKVGNVESVLNSGAKNIKASYNFAVQTHASIGPSCAVADYKDGKLTVWSASQATHSMQHELSVITGLPKESIRLVYLDGSGCYGRNGHEDATADAALAAIAIGKPVRLQWMRHDETALAPKSPPRTMDFEASLDAKGNITGWKSDFYIALNHIAFMKPLDFPLLAATDTGVPRPGNWVGFLFQNSAAPYVVPNITVNTKHIAQTFLRSSHLRSPGRIENSFGNESFMDELAIGSNSDPAEFRIKNLTDPRAIAVIRAAMKSANWQSREPAYKTNANSKIAKGRGIAYVRYNNSITYVATVADIELNRETGKILVKNLHVAHDCGQMINPDGVQNQIEGGAIQTVSRVLMEEVKWTGSDIESVDWASYPIVRFNEVPKVHTVLIDQPGTPSWGAGEQTPTTIPAAIANAVFDATGVRLRTIPFTPESVKLALKEQSVTRV
jgi:CO/xanthine dehydrogenase Mo-binding subunit